MIGAVAVVMAAAPAFAFADSSHSLSSSQIQAVLGLLQSFGVEQSVIANVQATLTGTPVTTSGEPGMMPGTSTSPMMPPSGEGDWHAASSTCLTLTQDMRMGERDQENDGEVSKLQSFLGINPTGFFGAMTANLLAHWQQEHGIASSTSMGAGMFGPRTRDALGCRTHEGQLPPMWVASGTPPRMGTTTWDGERRMMQPPHPDGSTTMMGQQHDN